MNIHGKSLRTQSSGDISNVSPQIFFLSMDIYTYAHKVYPFLIGPAHIHNTYRLSAFIANGVHLHTHISDPDIACAV